MQFFFGINKDEGSLIMKQLCYASCSTSSSITLLEDLRNILSEARDFNYRNAITGVLYYADGYFFQCLEGEDPVLELLVEKLRKDSRHREIMIYGLKTIDQTHFTEWAMKYVSRSSHALQYLHEQGQDKFRPFALNPDQVEAFVAYLYDAQPDEAA